MAIEHAASGQLIDIRPLGAQLLGAQSRALCKTHELEIMRLVIPAKRSVPPHHVDGDLTLQCLEGEVELTAGAKVTLISAGYMLWLARDTEYSIRAVKDSSLLMTIVMQD